MNFQTLICIGECTKDSFSRLPDGIGGMREEKVSMVYKSRHTPGLEDGRAVSFNVGEFVTYRERRGKKHRIKIDSELKTHDQAPGDKSGYEAIFPDGERAFAVRRGIIGWEGKLD